MLYEVSIEDLIDDELWADSPFFTIDCPVAKPVGSPSENQPVGGRRRARQQEAIVVSNRLAPPLLLRRRRRPFVDLFQTAARRIRLSFLHRTSLVSATPRDWRRVF